MIIINSGVLATLIVILINILVLTGWFKSIIEKIGKLNTISIYLVLTLIFFFINISINSSLTINIGGLILPIIGILYLLRKQEEKIYIICAILLLGTIYFLIKEVIYIEPVLLLGNEVIQFSILVSLIVIVIGTKIEHQVPIVLGGILLGDLFFNLNHKEIINQITLGGALTRDIIWLSLAQILLIKSLFSEIKLLFKKILSISIRTR